MNTGMSPRKLMGTGRNVPWSQLDSTSNRVGVGDFGISSHLGGKAFIPNRDGNRKFGVMADSERAIPHPSGGYQPHPRH